MKLHKVLNLLGQLSGPDIAEDFKQEEFQPSDDDTFIVEFAEEDSHENDVAVDIVSRNPLYADLSDTDELIMNVRQIANYAFLKEEYDEALSLYNIAIEITKNLPILFNSRALCYIRSLGNFKRAIIDCDYVINKLDEKSLNAWLFRAQGYFALGISSEFEKSLSEARKNHPKRVPEITELTRLIRAFQPKTTRDREGDSPSSSSTPKKDPHE